MVGIPISIYKKNENAVSKQSISLKLTERSLQVNMLIALNDLSLLHASLKITNIVIDFL